MSKAETALNFLKNGYNCSQSIMAAFTDLNKTSVEESAAIASAFGAGIARLQLTCGAVTGALMVIGMMHFDSSLPIADAKSNVYSKSLEFIEKFKNKHNSIECITLLGADLHTDEGKKRIQEQELFKTKCTSYVRSACEILDTL